ncbi:N-methyl-L-tryptophan oxidase [Ruania halotolerans]|uniref:N-methyl-L-tryptophan oxidase n=1 Tax=Ruania halotolerans TaxID=2897773 RepID=UPI001E2BADD5|nr:N-methyl-L-tryptophan oxidase [Ruania halotolerans]UFU06172.1 N-methyl-L-tryptophan oxidase [Ruania halotolerans]
MTSLDAPLAVLGLGAAGSSALWRAAARGADVIGFEQHTPGHPHGSSHGHSRLFRTALVEGPQYVGLAQHAQRLWRELEQVTGTELLTLCGGLFLGPEQGRLLPPILETIRAHDLPHELLDAAAVRSRFDQHTIDDGTAGVLDPGTGVVRAEAGIHAAVRAAVGLGAQVRTGERITAVEPVDTGVEVHSTGLDGPRTWRFGRVIMATGAWTPSLLPALTVPMQVRRTLLTWFGAPDAARFGPDRFGVFLHEADGYLAWGAPVLEGYGVKVGLHDLVVPAVDDPSTNPLEVAPHEWAEVAGWVSRRLPDLDAGDVRAEGCMYTHTPDEAFSIGAPAAYPGVVLAAACSGHGFKHATAVGDAAAALAVDEEPPVDLAPFSPDRFS